MPEIGYRTIAAIAASGMTILIALAAMGTTAIASAI